MPPKKGFLVIVSLICALVFLLYQGHEELLDAHTEKNLALETSNQRYNLNPHLELLKDHSRKLGFEDVSSAEYEEKFKLHGDPRAPSYSYTDAVIWMRFYMENVSERQRWFLEIGYPLLDQVDFFYPQEDGQYGFSRTGDSLPFENRQIEHRNFVFNIPSNWDEEQPFYLRVDTQSAMVIPVNVWEMDSFVSSAGKNYMGLGIYYGVLILIVLYTLFLYGFFKEKNYLYYTIFITAIGLFLFTFNGLSFQYLWPNYPQWGQDAINFFLFSGCASGYLFTAQIMSVKYYYRPADTLIKIIGGFAAVMMPLSLIIDFTLAMQLAIATALIGSGLVIISTVICWINKSRPAQFLFWGWLFFVGGVILMSMRSLGIMPDNFATMYGAQVGFLILLIFMFIGLADHLRIIGEERKQFWEGMKKQEQETESARSAFLFAQIKPHFLFHVLTTISYFTYADPEYARKIINDLSSFLQQSFDFKEIPNLVPIEDELELVKVYTNIEKARFTGQLELEINIDEELLKDFFVPPFSIQPLVENAILHGIRSKESGVGKVTVTAQETEGGKYIMVTDNGAGIPEDKIESLFEKEEEDRGIGFWNINKRLQNIWGSGLQVESEVGEGTTIKFFIPY